ncbi:hypothetical protein OA069_01430 [Paracoccaceae bacterium]|nr:hypothetical protein [Paracoccaceae bacterium]
MFIGLQSRPGLRLPINLNKVLFLHVSLNLLEDIFASFRVASNFATAHMVKDTLEKAAKRIRRPHTLR